ncbi:carboxypeptidase B-like [Achroia grisella]|uniref:carboxypeptidase B-like n=1 Tax=Achroia grisella TaxID=688607 RepID=UPI0027D22041|nr:carboxypeptidase B-like [Achroia grisella]
MLLHFSVLFFLTSVFAKNEEYKNYKVYNVAFHAQIQQDNFASIKDDLIDYWRYPSLENQVSGLAMVPPARVDWFEGRLKELDVAVDVHIEDLYEHLADKEKETTDLSRSDNGRAFSFDNYYRYDEILTYLYALEETYGNSPDISFRVIQYDYTEENRPLVYLQINNRNDVLDDTKPLVVIEAAINPRDWITVPAAINIANKLLESDQQRFLNNFEWIIVPVVNPDGYEYTHSTGRYWTKNRTVRNLDNLNFMCPGVNINRNLDFEWRLSGTSTSACSHLYGGLEPSSEPESRLLQSIIDENESRINLYISLQNNGGFISYPWYYERAASGLFISNHLLGLEIIDAMQGDYKLGVASVNIDPTSGTASDYARSKGVRYSYNIDIVQDTNNGVNIPAGDIVDIVEDVWRAVSVAADNLN